MSRITEMLLEPQTVYEGNTFTVKIKVRDDYKYKKYIVSENIKYTTIQGSSFTLTNVNPTQKASVIEIKGAGAYKRRLPIEYQEVEYIQNTGGAWIDTGIQPCMNKIRCLCEMSPMTNTDTAFFGSRGTYYLFYNLSGNYFWPINKCETIQGTLTVGNKYVVDWNKGTLEVTGTDGVYQKGVRSNNTQDTKNLYIFNFNPVDGRQALAKVYYFKIYIEDVLVRDFIPCKRKSDNVAGLYDLVENTFYSSITETQLSSGPELDTKNVEGFNNIIVTNKNINYRPLIQGLYQISNGAQVTNTKYVTLDGFLAVNSGETITIMTKNQLQGTFYILEYNQKGQYLNREQHIAQTQKATFSIQNNTTKYIAIDFTLSNNVDITPEQIEEIQIEKGENIEEYIENESGIFPIDLGGTNLVDFSTFTLGYVASNGTQNGSHTLNEMCSSFVKVQPNTSYTFSVQKTTDQNQWWIGIGEYTNNTVAGFVERKTQTYKNYMTFTTGATTEYVKLSARNLEHATEVQFQIGRFVTPYTPYGREPIILSSTDKIWNDGSKWKLNNIEIIDKYLVNQLQEINNIDVYENLTYMDWESIGWEEKSKATLKLQYATNEELHDYIITEDGKRIRTDWRKLGRRKKWKMK